MSTGPVYYGGQAVIEGVMIRGPRHMAVAVRHPRGHIVVHSEELSGLYTGTIRRVPLLRGVIVLWETLALGMRALAFSSQVAMEGETDERGEPVEFPQRTFWGMMAFAIAIAVAVFFALPIVAAHWIEAAGAPRLAVVGLETVLRLGLFVGYIAAIGLMPDIRRVFQYHGAEHMPIHAYEAREPLTIEAIRRFPKEHTRCGTSFLLVVVVVALAVFATFDALVDAGLLIRTASRILLVPVIAGVSYEILRLGARFERFTIVRWFFAPNIALQRLTTRVPDDEQIEVARAAFEATLRAAGLLIPGVREPAER